MRKYNNYILLLVSDVILSVFHWCSCNLKIIDNHKMLNDQEDLFLSLLCDNGGYEWRRSFMVIYIIPFILGVMFICSYDEKIISIIRLRSRKHFIKKYFQSLLICAVIFAFTHEIVNLIGMKIFFADELLLKYHMLAYTALNVVIITMFYLKVGLIFQLYKIYVSGAVSVIMTLVTYCTIFYSASVFPVIDKLNLSALDCSVIYYLVSGTITTGTYLKIFFKSMIIMLILLWLCCVFYQQKDILENEKK